MATVTNIDAVLSARTQGFDAGMKRGQQGLRSLQTSAAAASASVTGALGGMIAKAVAFGAAFLTARKALSSFNESAERLDKLAKTGILLAQQPARCRRS